MTGRFDGRVLFATGGGSGIGAAVARRFSSEGGKVAVADIDPHEPLRGFAWQIYVNVLIN